MRKNILIFKSSPRVKGNSNTLANKAADGARAVGATVETFSLHNMDIRPCDACDNCMETDGVCVVGDEMQILYPKLRQADGIILASPIYWFTFSAQLKAFIDRWYAFDGSEEHALSGKKFGIVLTYGDSDPYNSGAVNAIHTFDSIFSYLNADIVGLVYGSANAVGDVDMQPALLEKAYQLGRKIAEA